MPPKAVSLITDFLDRGIRYDERSNEEKEAWDALEWDEDGNKPEEIDAAAINRWLFNADTVDKVLQHLVVNGLKVENGDRLGKTIIFAKNQEHARFIVERFDRAYPEHAGSFARTNTIRLPSGAKLTPLPMLWSTGCGAPPKTGAR